MDNTQRGDCAAEVIYVAKFKNLHSKDSDFSTPNCRAEDSPKRGLISNRQHGITTQKRVELIFNVREQELQTSHKYNKIRRNICG
jgi:hypothetical protein